MTHLDLGPLVRPCCYIKKEYPNPIAAAVLAGAVAVVALAVAAGSAAWLAVAGPILVAASLVVAKILDS